MKVEYREFLSKNELEVDSVNYIVDSSSNFPTMDFTISNGYNTITFSLNTLDKKSFRQSLEAVYNLEKALNKFIELSKDAYPEAAKKVAITSVL